MMPRAASIQSRLALRWSNRSTTTAATTPIRPPRKSATRATSASCRRHGIFIELRHSGARLSASPESMAAADFGIAISSRRPTIETI
jgi:hypothetical protein